jgi:hypothetical protein
MPVQKHYFEFQLIEKARARGRARGRDRLRRWVREGGRERKIQTDKGKERCGWQRERPSAPRTERERGLDNLEATSIRDKVVREYIIIIIIIIIIHLI